MKSGRHIKNIYSIRNPTQGRNQNSNLRGAKAENQKKNYENKN